MSLELGDFSEVIEAREQKLAAIQEHERAIEAEHEIFDAILHGVGVKPIEPLTREAFEARVFLVAETIKQLGIAGSYIWGDEIRESTHTGWHDVLSLPEPRNEKVKLEVSVSTSDSLDNMTVGSNITVRAGWSIDEGVASDSHGVRNKLAGRPDDEPEAVFNEYGQAAARRLGQIESILTILLQGHANEVYTQAHNDHAAGRH